MKIDTILFVGLGGAGQRHLRIFKDLLPPRTEFISYRAKNKTPLLNSDFSVDNGSTVEDRYNVKSLGSLGDCLKANPDFVVISNPTSLHYDIASWAAENKINIFAEKPFSDSLEGFHEFEDLVLTNDLYFFISFQRRFHPFLKKIKALLEQGMIGKIIQSVFNVSTFVPEWHPYEDFRELYACRKDLGGGVLLTEIHEIDLCYWYFGVPTHVYCTGDNYSEYALDVEDTAHLTLRYPSFTVQINLCFMQKHNLRNLFIAGTEGYIEWDMNGNQLSLRTYDDDKQEIFSDPDLSNDKMFYDQATYFLNEFKRSESSKQLETAKNSLAIVGAAKKSILNRTEIKLGRSY